MQKTFNLTPTFIDQYQLRGATKIILLWLYSRSFFDKTSQSHCAVKYTPTKWAPDIGYTPKTIITAIRNLARLGLLRIESGKLYLTKPDLNQKPSTNSCKKSESDQKSKKGSVKVGQPEQIIDRTLKQETKMVPETERVSHDMIQKALAEIQQPKKVAEEPKKPLQDLHKKPHLIVQLEEAIIKNAFDKKKLAAITIIRRNEFEQLLRTFHKNPKFDQVLTIPTPFGQGERFENMIKFIDFHWDDEQFPRYVLFLFLQYFTDKKVPNPHGYFITALRNYQEKPLMERLPLLNEISNIRMKMRRGNQLEENLKQTEDLLRKSEYHTNCTNDIQVFIDRYLPQYPESMAEAERLVEEQMGGLMKDLPNPSMLNSERSALRERTKAILIRSKLLKILTEKVQ